MLLQQRMYAKRVERGDPAVVVRRAGAGWARRPGAKVAGLPAKSSRIIGRFL